MFAMNWSHHNAVFTTLSRYDNLMDFSRMPISSVVHIAVGVSVLADGNMLKNIQ